MTLNERRSSHPAEPENDKCTSEILRDIVDGFGCISGTLHRSDGDTLELVAHIGIPDAVLPRIETIPIGKGMAGLAAERMEPVDVCNLQTDSSGVAEDGARATGMEGSLAAPIVGLDGTLKGTIGIAKSEQYEFTPEERDQLMDTARQITDRL